MGYGSGCVLKWALASRVKMTMHHETDWEVGKQEISTCHCIPDSPEWIETGIPKCSVTAPCHALQESGATRRRATRAYLVAIGKGASAGYLSQKCWG